MGKTLFRKSPNPEEKTTRALGRCGEDIAEAFLRKRKFRIVERGYRFHRGEIDFIAWDRQTLVFVEVKTRRGKSFGRPEESVTPAKQAQIRKVALGYLVRWRLDDVPCRFDVVSVRVRGGDGCFRVDHFKDAF